MARKKHHDHDADVLNDQTTEEGAGESADEKAEAEGARVSFAQPAPVKQKAPVNKKTEARTRLRKLLKFRGNV